MLIIIIIITVIIYSNSGSSCEFAGTTNDARPTNEERRSEKDRFTSTTSNNDNGNGNWNLNRMHVNNNGKNEKYNSCCGGINAIQDESTIKRAREQKNRGDDDDNNSNGRIRYNNLNSKDDGWHDGERSRYHMNTSRNRRTNDKDHDRDNDRHIMVEVIETDIV